MIVLLAVLGICYFIYINESNKHYSYEQYLVDKKIEICIERMYIDLYNIDKSPRDRVFYYGDNISNYECKTAINYTENYNKYLAWKKGNNFIGMVA